MAEHAGTIHIIEDDASMRTALARLLTASGYTVRDYPDASAFLVALDATLEGCIVLDIDMPGMDGVALQQRLLQLDCPLPIVFLTGQGDIATSVRAVKAGAEDFLCKPVERAPLLDAVNRGLARYRRQAASADSRRHLARRYDDLTAREREVFALLLTGALNKQIADTLGNTERTVKAQRRAVMEKFGVRSVAELVAIATELGLR